MNKTPKATTTVTREKSVEIIGGISYVVTTSTIIEKSYVEEAKHTVAIDAQIAKLQAEKSDVVAKASLAVEAEVIK